VPCDVPFYILLCFMMINGLCLFVVTIPIAVFCLITSRFGLVRVFSSLVYFEVFLSECFRPFAH